MTAVAGVVKDGRVWIGADSAGTDGWDAQTLRSDRKVFRRTEGGEDWIFGFTHSYRMGQLIRYELTLPHLPRRIDDLLGFMVTDFVRPLRHAFKTGGFMEVDNGVERGGSFLVGVRGRLFRIGPDQQVGEPSERYDAVGSGYMVALGALHALPKLQPADRVRAALRAACAHIASVAEPIHVVSTREGW